MLISQTIKKQAFFYLAAGQVFGALTRRGNGWIVGIDYLADCRHVELLVFFQMSADGHVKHSHSFADD